MKKPGLRARAQSVKAAMTAGSDEPAEEGEVKTMSLRVSVEQYERLRRLAFDSRRSMTQILREALDDVLAKHRN